MRHEGMCDAHIESLDSLSLVPTFRRKWVAVGLNFEPWKVEIPAPRDSAISRNRAAWFYCESAEVRAGSCTSRTCN